MSAQFVVQIVSVAFFFTSLRQIPATSRTDFMVPCFFFSPAEVSACFREPIPYLLATGQREVFTSLVLVDSSALSEENGAFPCGLMKNLGYSTCVSI